MNRRHKIELIIWICFILVITLLVVITEHYFQRSKEDNTINNFQETAGVLTYQYNFTKCVFTIGEKHAVCNLLMKESCKDIKRIDENCEVLG